MKETISTELEFKEIFKKLSFEKSALIILDDRGLFDDEDAIHVDISFHDFNEKINKRAYHHAFSEVCKNFYISEDIITKYFPYFDVNDICQHQILSETFIRRFKNCIDWKLIFLFQETSKNLYNDFNDKVKVNIIEVEEIEEPTPGIGSVSCIDGVVCMWNDGEWVPIILEGGGGGLSLETQINNRNPYNYITNGINTIDIHQANFS